MPYPRQPSGRQPDGRQPDGRQPSVDEDAVSPETPDVWRIPLLAYRAAERGEAGNDEALIRLGRRIATGSWE